MYFLPQKYALEVTDFKDRLRIGISMKYKIQTWVKSQILNSSMKEAALEKARMENIVLKLSTKIKDFIIP